MPDLVRPTFAALPASAADGRRPDVQRVDPRTDPKWDERLEDCPAATFFHRASWARVLQETYGYTPVYLVRDDGPDRAVLPLMEVNSWLTGRRGIALPFTDECEALAGDPAARRELLRAALTHARLRRWRYLEIRGRHTWLEAPTSVSYWGHTLTLDRDPSALFSKFHGSARTSARKAVKAGVTLEFSTELESVLIFHRLLAKTRQRLGVPPQPLCFFKNLHRHALARQEGCVVLARWQGIPIAGAVFLHSSKQAMYKFGASDDAYQFLRPNNLVMWRAIEWYAQRGFERLDFGRTSLGNEGLRRFKLSWGATERRIEYARYDIRAGAFASTQDRAAGWHSPVFRRLPLWCSRVLGALLYRHVA